MITIIETRLYEDTEKYHEAYHLLGLEWIVKLDDEILAGFSYSQDAIVFAYEQIKALGC